MLQSIRFAFLGTRPDYKNNWRLFKISLAEIVQFRYSFVQKRYSAMQRLFATTDRAEKSVNENQAYYGDHSGFKRRPSRGQRIFAF